MILQFFLGCKQTSYWSKIQILKISYYHTKIMSKNIVSKEMNNWSAVLWLVKISSYSRTIELQCFGMNLNDLGYIILVVKININEKTYSFNHNYVAPRVGKEYKNLCQTLADMIFPCLNFPCSFLMGRSNQNKQCQEISSFCLISFFFNFQRTHDRIDIYRFPNRKLYFLRF